MWGILWSRKIINVNFLLISVGYINLAIWFFFGYLFIHKDFEKLEIIFPLLILMLNTIVALSVILFSVFLWEGRRNFSFYASLLPSVILLAIEFIIVYPNIGEIFFDKTS